MGKRCSRCGLVKPLDAFARRGDNGRRQGNCRECNSEYLKEHYAANRPYYLAKARRRRLRTKAKHHARLREYFASHPCVDCGESDPVVLQFDHVRGEKTYNIGTLVAAAAPWERIAREIAKCDVRCANCHWRRTAAQFNWYAYLETTPDGG